MDVNRRKRGEKRDRGLHSEEFGRREEKKRGRKPKMEMTEDEDDFLRKGRFSEGELNFEDLEFEIRDWDE